MLFMGIHQIFNNRLNRLRQEGAVISNSQLVTSLCNSALSRYCPLSEKTGEESVLKISLSPDKNGEEDRHNDVMPDLTGDPKVLGENDFVISFIRCPECEYGQDDICRLCLLNAAGLKLVANETIDILGIQAQFPPRSI